MLIGRRGGRKSLLHLLSPSKPMYTDMHKYTCFILQQRKAVTASFLARPPFPSVPVCMSQFGERETNQCGALFPSSWGEDLPASPKGFTVSLWADSVGSHKSPKQPKLCSAGSSKRVLPVGCGIIIRWRGTHLANEHPVALFLWTWFSVSLFFWIRSFYHAFQIGKQQVSLQRGFSSPENLCLFFILLFSSSKISENNLTCLICWIYTLLLHKLISPHHLLFLSSLRAVGAVS